jgi:cell division protease FtsH
MPADDGAAQPPGRRPNWKLLAWLFVGYVVVFGLLTTQDQMGGAQTISYTEFTEQVEDGNVEEVFARGDSIQGVLSEAAPLPAGEDGTYEAFETERPTFAQDDLLADLEDSGATVRATPVVEERGTLANLLFSFAPILLLVGFYYWIFKRQQQAMGGGLFGGGGGKKKPVDPETVRVSFDDVAGIDEVEAEISEVVDYLKDPDKYRRLGARAPRGVLLAGAPGTGKTLLARATAGEANVPFFSASASEFIEMIVGVGASRVRELFTEARKVAPAIIFIDEIDTIGRARGGARAVGGHDEREQTLNQILTEMDGFSGAAALLAARRGEQRVTQRDLTDSLEKIQLGTARNVVMPPEERRRTAYHEAGHALLGMLQPGADPVRKVSIIPRGRALGVTLSTPQTDRYGYDANYLRGRIIGALGGMAAEDEVFDVVTTGAESDLENATRIARSMVGR